MPGCPTIWPISSSAIADSHHGVGYNDNGSGTLKVRYTLLGDTNLDGTVNFVDLLKLAQNYNATGTLWSTGDSSYDGTTNFVDLLALAQNYNTSLGPISFESTAFQQDWQLAQAEAALEPSPGDLPGRQLARGTRHGLARLRLVLHQR